MSGGLRTGNVFAWIRLRHTRLSGGHDFFYYSVAQFPYTTAGREVEVSREEADAWAEAGRRYSAILTEAHTLLDSMQRRPPILPGAYGRASRCYRRIARRATATYRPVSETIKARLAQPKTDAEIAREQTRAHEALMRSVRSAPAERAPGVGGRAGSPAAHGYGPSSNYGSDHVPGLTGGDSGGGHTSGGGFGGSF
ncbi:hypothetical protein [Actinomycetospora flava]|uniref:Uncharacterized protein n=1 Tax=Actinomycetospora flava TaxID=3129232 RepID=A0ABU8M5C5_9PSEU